MAIDLNSMLAGMAGNIFAALNNPPPPSMVRPTTEGYFQPAIRPAVMPGYALPNLPLPPGLPWGNPNWGDSTMHIGEGSRTGEPEARIGVPRWGLGRPPGLDLAQLIHQALFNPEFQGFGRTMNPADMARAVEQFQNLGRPPGNLLDVARGMLGSLYGRMSGPFGFLGWPGQMGTLPQPSPSPTLPPPSPTEGRGHERQLERISQLERLTGQERRELLGKLRGF
jgi:hypothetical protein